MSILFIKTRDGTESHAYFETDEEREEMMDRIIDDQVGWLTVLDYSDRERFIRAADITTMERR